MSEMAHSGKQKGPVVGLLPNSDVEKTRRWEQGKDTYLDQLRMGLSKGSENGTDLHQARIKGSGD
uniref:Uncharacterized protein n=1 Tax=Arundo donax TaxID=35708 RepID=A0A0A8ZMG2_ARUDO